MLPDPGSLPLLSFESRGDPMKAVKVKASIKKKASQADLFTQTIRAFYEKAAVHKWFYLLLIMCLVRYRKPWPFKWWLQQWEFDKGIVEASNFAAAVTGFSHKVVWKWALAYFSTLAQYPCSLDVDDQHIETERYLSEVKPAVTQVQSCMTKNFNLLLENLCTEMLTERANQISQQRFCKWVKDSFDVVIALGTGWQWLHHLGLNICNHQKVYFLMAMNVMT